MLLYGVVSGVLLEWSSGDSILPLGVLCRQSRSFLCVCWLLLLYVVGFGDIFHDLSFSLQGLSVDFDFFSVWVGGSFCGSSDIAVFVTLEYFVFDAFGSDVGVLFDRSIRVCDDKKIF